MNWCERYLTPSGNIGKNVDRSILANTGIFAYVEAKNGLIGPWGGPILPDVWEIQPDLVGPGESVVRLNYTANPDISAAENYDLVVNAEGTESAVATNTKRMFFIGNTLNPGTAGFWVGEATGTQWDAANRGFIGLALGGLDNTVDGDFTAIAGGNNNQTSADNTGIFAGQLNRTADVAIVDNAAIVGGDQNVIGVVGQAEPITAAAILGGRINVCESDISAILGGTGNNINDVGGNAGICHVIAGGSGNVIGGNFVASDTDFNAILAGFTGRMSRAGQPDNMPSSSVILGGATAQVHNINNADPSFEGAAVIAGSDCRARADYSAVVGGTRGEVFTGASTGVVVAGNTQQVNAPNAVTMGGAAGQPALAQNVTLRSHRFRHTGGMQSAVLSVAANQLLNLDHYIVLVSIAGAVNIVITAPAAPVAGQSYWVKKRDADGATTVSLSGNGNNFIDVDGTALGGAMAVGDAVLGGVVHVVYDGTDWQVITDQ